MLQLLVLYTQKSVTGNHTVINKPHRYIIRIFVYHIFSHCADFSEAVIFVACFAEYGKILYRYKVAKLLVIKSYPVVYSAFKAELAVIKELCKPLVMQTVQM